MRTGDKITKAKIKKLPLNTEIKNYPTLCLILNVPQKKGYSKEKQLKEIQQFCDLQKVQYSQKYIVTEIYKHNKYVVDKRSEGNTSIYVPLIQNILLSDFISANTNTILITKNDLIKKLGMANEFYFAYISEKNALNSDILKSYNSNWDKWQIDKNISSIKSKFNTVIKTALDNLQKNKIIKYEKRYIAIENNIQYIIDDPDEIEMIMYYERETLNYFNNINKDIEIKTAVDLLFNNVTDDSGKRITLNEYYKIVASKLKREYNWDFYYSSYYIICNRSYIKWQIDKNIELIKNELNIKLQDAIKKESNSTYKRYHDKLPNLYRENYCDVQNELTNFFLTLYSDDTKTEILQDINKIIANNKNKIEIQQLLESNPELEELF